jgi:hypothetical protein
METRKVVKEVPHARLYSDGTIFVGPVRASYPHWAMPYSGNDDSSTPRFSVVGLMPKTKEYFAAKDLIRDRIRDILREQNKGKDLPADKKFIRDGDQSGRDEYEGMYSIHAAETKRPQARDNRKVNGKPARLDPKEDADRIYAGCWVNLLLRPWFQNNKFGRRVNAGFVAVQFVGDDEPFGEGRIDPSAVDDTFDDFADDDSGYDDGLEEDDEL